MSRWAWAAAIAVACWLVLGYCTAPADAHAYRRTAVASAEEALSATRTAALAATADEDGRLLGPYLSALLDDELGAVAGAHRKLAALQPPDEDSRALRDDLVPLLDEAQRQLTAEPLDLDALSGIGDELDDFVARHR
jgi:hypothetical protein